MKRLQNQITYFAANQLRKMGVNFNELENEQVQEMKRAINSLDGNGILFTIENYPDGSWSAESINIDGIMTGSRDPREVSSLIKDAIFTYFEIPPQLCMDDLVRSDNEPVTTKQRAYVRA